MKSVLAAFAIVAGVPVALALLLLALGAVATVLISLRVGAAYPPAGPFVPVRGGRLATLQAGPAEGARATVVLIHGASANAADPMEGVGRLLVARGFRVVAFDRPGLGWSDRLAGPAAADPAVQARVVAEALRTMAAPPALVLGHSWGSALALALALDHPDRVAGLALVSPVALPFPQRMTLPWYWRLAAEPPVAWLLSRTLGPPLALYHLRGAAVHAFRPQAPVVREMVKPIYKRTNGWFAASAARGTPAFQPYVHHAIRAASMVGMLHTVKAIGAQSGTWPLVVADTRRSRAMTLL